MFSYKTQPWQDVKGTAFVAKISFVWSQQITNSWLFSPKLKSIVSCIPESTGIKYVYGQWKATCIFYTQPLTTLPNGEKGHEQELLAINTSDIGEDFRGTRQKQVSKVEMAKRNSLQGRVTLHKANSSIFKVTEAEAEVLSLYKDGEHQHPFLLRTKSCY